MGILLDILCIGLLAASVVVFTNKSVSSALLSLGALLLSLIAAFLLSFPLGSAVLPLFTPAVERSAANRLADLFSAPHLADGRETVAALDFDELIQNNPPEFQKILDHYGANIDALRNLPDAHTSADVLNAVAGLYSRTLSRAVSYAVLFWRRSGWRATWCPRRPCGGRGGLFRPPWDCWPVCSGFFRWRFCWNGWCR